MRARLAIVALCLLVGGAAPAVEWGFDDHLSPLDLGEDGWISSEACRGCHPDVYADWRSSRHRASWDNPVFEAGYIVEPQDFCVYCHAPLAEQSAEVLRNREWYRAQHPRSTAAAPPRLPEPRAAEGVNCVACHWRERMLQGPSAPENAAHPVAAAPELSDSSFCAGCHEFRMAAGHGGRVAFTPEPMQQTYAEWRAWGGAERCQDCHMPDGRHLFRGAHDTAFLRAAVSVDVWRDGGTVRFCVESVGVGHSMPTGDLFRRLSLQVDDGGGFEEVATFGRTFRLVADPVTGEVEKRLAQDSSLLPGVPREVSVATEAPLRWRLRYHMASPQDERNGLVPVEGLVVVLHEGGL